MNGNQKVSVEPARHWINGEWIGSPPIANSVSNSTGEVLGQYSAGGRTEAAAAIAAARNAFDNGTWAYDPQLRSRALLELADRLDERAEAIALMLSREMGKTLRDATWEPAAKSAWDLDCNAMIPTPLIPASEIAEPGPI